MRVIAKYIPKKKSIQIKGFKGYKNKKRLKKSHAFTMSFDTIEKGGWIKGSVNLDEVNSLEQKKAPRPKWKQQVRVEQKANKICCLVDAKTGERVKEEYGSRMNLFLENNKIFVL